MEQVKFGRSRSPAGKLETMEVTVNKSPPSMQSTPSPPHSNCNTPSLTPSLTHSTSSNSSSSLESPNRIEIARKAIEEAIRGEGPTSCCVQLTLFESEYDAVFKQLDSAQLAFVTDHLRFDYIDDELTIRMPGTVHELLSHSLANKMYSRLQDVREKTKCEALKTAISSLTILSTADIRLSDNKKISPDNQFHYRGYKGSPLVLEVAYSQNPADLNLKARETILSAKGDVRTMVGIDIDYRGDNTSGRGGTFTIWRYRRRYEQHKLVSYVQAHPENCPFTISSSSASSSSIQRKNLVLRLSDFVPMQRWAFMESEGLVENPSIIITAEELDAMLRDAELVEKDQKEALLQEKDRKAIEELQEKAHQAGKTFTFGATVDDDQLSDSNELDDEAPDGDEYDDGDDGDDKDYEGPSTRSPVSIPRRTRSLGQV